MTMARTRSQPPSQGPKANAVPPLSIAGLATQGSSPAQRNGGASSRSFWVPATRSEPLASETATSTVSPGTATRSLARSTAPRAAGAHSMAPAITVPSHRRPAMPRPPSRSAQAFHQGMALAIQLAWQVPAELAEELAEVGGIGLPVVARHPQQLVHGAGGEVQAVGIDAVL